MKRTGTIVSQRASRSIEVIQSELNVLKEELSNAFFSRGLSFEKELLSMCLARGMKARKVRRQCSVDLVVEGKRVQCKATNCDGSRLRIYAGNKLSYGISDFDVLAIRVSGEIYFVPAASLRSGRGSKMKNLLRLPSIKKWLNAWHVFDGLIASDDEPLLFNIAQPEATDGR